MLFSVQNNLSIPQNQMSFCGGKDKGIKKVVEIAIPNQSEDTFVSFMKGKYLNDTHGKNVGKKQSALLDKLLKPNRTDKINDPKFETFVNETDLPISKGRHIPDWKPDEV